MSTRAYISRVSPSRLAAAFRLVLADAVCPRARYSPCTVDAQVVSLDDINPLPDTGPVGSKILDVANVGNESML